MGIDVYEQIPVMESEKFLLREIKDGDAEDLLKVYSDKEAVPLFNSDNCENGFYYTSIEEMKDTIAFWKREYQSRYYVRWTIIDKSANCAIGTIELFNRKAKDYFNNCGLLRLDLRSDYEKQDAIEDILAIIIPETREMVACEMIATKAVSIAQERIQALEHMGFCLSEETLIGQVERLHEPKTFPWLQRGIHIFDPDGHLIEVSESMYSVACKQFESGKTIEETANLVQHPIEVVRGLYEQYQKELISICGTDCSACYCFGKMCNGCNSCEGKVFHAADGKACPIYDCVRNSKCMQNCGECGEVPCKIWFDTRDPRFSDEEFNENIAMRVQALKKE